MSNYKNLFEELLSNFLNDDFIENAQKLFNDQKKECKCEKEVKEACNDNKPCTCKTPTSTFVRSEVMKTTKDGFEFKTFLPGVCKNNIKIDIKNDIMKIYLVGCNEQNLEFMDKTYCKNIVLGDQFNYGGITAEYKDSILRVFVPCVKKEEHKLEIKIN